MDRRGAAGPAGGGALLGRLGLGVAGTDGELPLDPFRPPSPRAGQSRADPGLAAAAGAAAAPAADVVVARCGPSRASRGARRAGRGRADGPPGRRAGAPARRARRAGPLGLHHSDRARRPRHGPRRTWHRPAPGAAAKRRARRGLELRRNRLRSAFRPRSARTGVAGPAGPGRRQRFLDGCAAAELPAVGPRPGGGSGRLHEPAAAIQPEPGAAARGAHGYPAELDSMASIFYALGRGVGAGRLLGPVRAVDLAPSVAALLGIEPPLASEGRSLLSELAPRECSPTRCSCPGPAAPRS